MYQLQDLHRDGPPPLPVDDWAVRRADVLRRWREALGPMPEIREPVYDIEDRVTESDHERLKISYATSDGDHVPALLLIPSGRRSGAGVLALHPTVSAGKDDVATTRGRPNRRYGIDLVRRGHVVLAPDTITAGERVAPGLEPYRTADFVASHPELSPIGKILADHRQGVSVLASLPDVDPDRIGAVGHSLGGYNAWFLASMDERVTAVASSCGYATFAGDPDPHHWGQRDWFSHFPLLSEGLDRGVVPFEFHEVMALIAPRPLFVWLTTGDRFFPNWMPSARSLHQISELYESLGASDHFVSWLGNGPHDFPEHVSAAAYRFLDARLT